MVKFMILGLTLGLASAGPPAAGGADVFPYSFKLETLENGLKVVSIPLPNPDIISYYTIVRSGSRNEVEPGKSGFAHFFEHMMFKGTKAVPRPAYDDFLTRLGAGMNGMTTDDYTFYFIVFAGRENLESVVRTEADRFINLDYDEEMLRTEAPVIEGEYYASVSSPARRLNELLRDTAFVSHSYKHSTLGYLRDIQDMPNQFEYSRLYKQRFYAPDNTVLLVAGDFDQVPLMEYVKRYYGPWERSGYELVTPQEPPQTEPKRAHCAWPSKTLPRLAVGFHGPAYSDNTVDTAALGLLAEIAFSPSSRLYQKLVIREPKCQWLGADFEGHRDPYLLTVSAVLKDDADLADVEAQIFAEIEKYKTEPVARTLLADVKSNLRYSLAARLGTTDGVAGALIRTIGLTADPASLDRLHALYDAVTPDDIMAAVKKYFVKTNSTVATLSEGAAR